MKLTLIVLMFAGFALADDAADQAAKTIAACKEAHVTCTVTTQSSHSDVWVDGKPLNPTVTTVTATHEEEKNYVIVPVFVGGRVVRYVKQPSRWNR